jgi:pimeloyl-ACP methyl ester carboxylesterase
MDQGLLMIRDSDLRQDVKKINIPTVIFHGKLDKLCPFELGEQLHAGIANSKLIPFENSGHALFLEELPKFNEELIRFVKDTSFIESFEANQIELVA